MYSLLGQGLGPITRPKCIEPFFQDVVRAPLNWHLAEATAIELQKASDNLVQLYKRISLDYDLEEGPRKELLHKLASTAGIAQQTLRPVVPSGYALAHVSSMAIIDRIKILRFNQI